MADRARIRSMQVRPSQSADLAFNMSGIIDRQNYDWVSRSGPAHLGETVAAFDIAGTLYDHLGETLPAVTTPGDPAYPREASARLKYDSSALRAALATAPKGGGPAPYLFALRNEALAASLDQNIDQRENAYLEKYKHASLIKQAMQKALPAIVTRIQNMQKLAQKRFDAIDSTYGKAEKAGRDPVVVQSVTTSEADAGYAVTTESTTKNKSLAMLNGNASLLQLDLTDVKGLVKNLIAENDDSNGQVVTHIWDQTGPTQVSKQITDGAVNLSFARTSDGKDWQFPADEFVSQEETSKTTTVGKQIATTANQSFLHPRLDNNLANEQLQAALLADEMNQTIASFRVDFMERILGNELAAIDLEARKIQTNFAHTYLTSPIAGTVTAVYKDLGESVQAGEPVLRVENDDVVFAVGQVLFRGLLRVGQSIVIHIDDLFADGTSLDVPGVIKAVRGHDSDNDEWELVIECANPLVGGKKALPIYYEFDRDLAHIEIP